MDHLGWRALATPIMRAKLWHRASFTSRVDKQTFDWLICRGYRCRSRIRVFVQGVYRLKNAPTLHLLAAKSNAALRVFTTIGKEL